jgi:hypothetical protein
MKNPLKIPKGWRRLRNGTRIQKGDKLSSPYIRRWLPSGNYLLPENAKARNVEPWATYIRKIK